MKNTMCTGWHRLPRPVLREKTYILFRPACDIARGTKRKAINAALVHGGKHHQRHRRGASFFSRSTSSCSVSPQPQTATRPSTPRDSAPLAVLQNHMLSTNQAKLLADQRIGRSCFPHAPLPAIRHTQHISFMAESLHCCSHRVCGCCRNNVGLPQSTRCLAQSAVSVR